MSRSGSAIGSSGGYYTASMYEGARTPSPPVLSGYGYGYSSPTASFSPTPAGGSFYCGTPMTPGTAGMYKGMVGCIPEGTLGAASMGGVSILLNNKGCAFKPTGTPVGVMVYSPTSGTLGVVPRGLSGSSSSGSLHGR